MSCRAFLSTAMLAVLFSVVGTTAEAQIDFVTHTIDTELTRGYQTVVVDLNRDSRPDVIALSTRLPDLVWYENPTWQRHVIASNLNRMINVAAYDIDADGIPELALAHGFATSHDESLGIVSVLTHQGDSRHLWTIREIDRTPTAHRLRWADIDGSGSKVLVNAPLVGAKSTRPNYYDSVSLLWYEPDDWERRVVTDEERGVIHGIGAVSWADPTRDAVLSASFLGVHVHEFTNGRWIRTRVTAGGSSPWPETGASEVQVGQIGSERFVVTIEPWHGHQVVVYRVQAGSSQTTWNRRVIDATLEDGHALLVADFDGDGRDEIIAGERRGRQSVYLYQLGEKSSGWTRQLVDDGDMAAAGCAVSDVDGKNRLDIVCIGTATANLKWYENVSP